MLLPALVKSLPSTQISLPAVPADGSVTLTTDALVLLTRITDWVSVLEIDPAGWTGEIAKLFWISPWGPIGPVEPAAPARP
jgi:hypothetical protein